MPRTSIVFLTVISLSILSLMLVSTTEHTVYSQQPTSTLALPTGTPEGTPAGSNGLAVQTIEMDSMVEGELDVAQWDIWEFEAEEGLVVTITLNSVRFDPFLELYKAGNDQVPIAVDDDGGRRRNAQLRQITLPADGTYRIFARSFDDEGEGAYQLLLDSFSDLGTAPDMAHVTSYSATESGTLENFEAVYSFEAESGDVVTAAVSSLDFDTYLMLTDSTGEVIAENDDNELGEKNSAITNVPIPVTDTYYLFVTPFDFEGSGEYSLAIYETSQLTEAPGGSIGLSEIGHGVLTPNSFGDWVFEGEEDQVVSLTAVTDVPEARLNLMLELYGPDGTLLEADTDSGLLLNPAMTDFRLPEDGEYRIRVLEQLPLIGGAYRVSVAPGRVYFGPGGSPARLIALNDESVRTPVTMLNADEPFDLWLLINADDEPLTIMLETSGGEASLDDFTIRLADTNWNFAGVTDNGTLTVDELPDSDAYLILVQYTGLGTLDYQLTITQ
ncbi:MAG: PPC domain-containing protein [Chloroflexi bacterium]|nr:PPC domain-containing protein [Chloroflexota bacterium]